MWEGWVSQLGWSANREVAMGVMGMGWLLGVVMLSVGQLSVVGGHVGGSVEMTCVGFGFVLLVL